MKMKGLQVREGSIASAGVSERAAFIAKTYGHLAGAVFAWVLCMVVMHLTIPESFMLKLVPMISGIGWLVVLGAFMVVSHIAHRWAMSDSSAGMQYMGLGLYVLAEALIVYILVFCVATLHADTSVLPQAAVITLGMFAGLTAIVFFTRKDFSFLKGLLWVGAMVALGLIVVAVLFGFHLGMFFSIAMIGLMCGFILYSTSNVLHHYREGQHVAASLALFASLATLFWYVLMLVSGSRD